MPAMKCPNAQCTFRFDPAKVPAGAVLTCPRCAMRFTLGTHPPSAPPAGYGVPAGYPATATFNPGELPGIPSDVQPTMPLGNSGVATSMRCPGNTVAVRCNSVGIAHPSGIGSAP